MNQGPDLCYKCEKNDLVNINADTKFGKIQTFCSKDIEQKQHSELNQGPYLYHKCAKNDV